EPGIEIERALGRVRLQLADWDEPVVGSEFQGVLGQNFRETSLPRVGVVAAVDLVLTLRSDRAESGRLKRRKRMHRNLLIERGGESHGREVQAKPSRLFAHK